MTNIYLNRKKLRGGSALQALALMGASIGGTSMFAAPAAAQDFTSGTLLGRVETETGERINEGSATITSDAQGFTRSAEISNGQFRIPQLPIGTYSVEVTAPGYSSLRVPSVQVIAGSVNTYTFKLPVPVAGEDIVVTGTAERGNDFAATQTGLNISDVTQLVQTVPVPRNQTSLILLAPGTVQGDAGFGNLATIGGASVAENAFYVNGLNITDLENFLGSGSPPFEFYQSYDVKTGGIPAEFGRSLGGVTNAVTKSGSNKFKAGAVVFWEPDGLRSDSPNTYAAFNQNDYNEEVNASLYLSGPIIKDRLFFYALYNPQFDKTQADSITSGQRYIQKSDSPFFGGKIDAIITDGHRLEATYFRDKRDTKTDYFGFDPDLDRVGDYLGTVNNSAGGDNFVFKYTGAFTDFFTLSGSYGEAHQSATQQPVPNNAYIVSALTGTNTLASGFEQSVYNNQNTRKQYRLDADLYVTLFGEHHFRAGYDREDLNITALSYYSGGGYRYSLQPSYVNRYYYYNDGSFDSKMEAFYIQDSWQLFDNRLNLNLGLRNDRFKNKTVEGESFFDPGNQWGPRLGASFDVFGDARTKVNVFWGRYFLPVALNTNTRLAGRETYYRQIFEYPDGVDPSDYNGVGLPNGLVLDDTGSVEGLSEYYVGSQTCPTSGPDAGEVCYSVTGNGQLGAVDTLVSSTLQPSYSDEFVVGITQKVADWTFGVNFIHRTLGRTLDDLAVDAAVIAYCDREGIPGCADVWTGFHQYVLSNPGDDLTVRLDGDCEVDERQCGVATLAAADLGFPKAVRKYDSIQFQFDRPWDGKWLVNGSYTYTKLRGNYEGAVISNINQTDAGLTQDFDQPGLLDGAYGPLANGREHEFKIRAAYQLTDWFQLSTNILATSPRKFSCLGNYPDVDNFANAYGAFSYYCQQQAGTGGQPITWVDQAGETRTSYLVPRGKAFKSDWETSIDIGVQFDITQLPGTSFRVDVFNVLNSKSKIDFNEFGDIGNGGPNSRYGQVTGYQTPRYVRLTFTSRFGEGN